MVTIQGLYNTAVCYTPELEEAARKQIQAVCDQVEYAGCKIRIMPDVHAGKGCTIGTTMTKSPAASPLRKGLVRLAAQRMLPLNCFITEKPVNERRQRHGKKITQRTCIRPDAAAPM